MGLKRGIVGIINDFFICSRFLCKSMLSQLDKGSIGTRSKRSSSSGGTTDLDVLFSPKPKNNIHF